jgi:hypothetical protein
MNGDTLKALHREWLTSGLARGEHARFATWLSPGHVIHQTLTEPIGPGPDPFVHALRRLDMVLRPWLVRIVAQAASDTNVVTRFDAFGKHVGKLGSVWPSGQWLRFTGLLWTQFAGGVAIESWLEVDAFGALSSLGAVRLSAGIVLVENGGVQGAVEPQEID